MYYEREMKPKGAASALIRVVPVTSSPGKDCVEDSVEQVFSLHVTNECGPSIELECGIRLLLCSPCHEPYS